MDQDIHMLLEGTIAEINVKLEPKLYRKYIWKNRHNKLMLYIKLKKGTIWYTTGGTAVLEITIQYIVGMGFQDQ